MVIAIAFSMAVLVLQAWFLDMDIWWLAYICSGVYTVCIIVAQIKENELRNRISALEKQLTKKGGE